MGMLFAYLLKLFKMVKLFILKTTLFSLIIFNCYGQKKSNDKVDPYSVIIQVLNYSNTYRYTGISKSGYVYGDAYFNFSKMSRQFPNVLVTYTALNREARDGGILRNIKYVNSGEYNTKIIVADWVNFDKTVGSGTFELSIIGENKPNNVYIGIQGSSWSWYFNIELSNQQFQDLINLLTISGTPQNPIKERDEKIKATVAAEMYQKEEADRKFRIQEALEKRLEFNRDFLKKEQEDIQNNIRLKDNLRKKFIRDSIVKQLEIGDEFEDGIVIDFQNDKSQVILLSKDEFYYSKKELFDVISKLKSNMIDSHKWQIPSYGNMNYVAKLLRSNKNFKKVFFQTKLSDDYMTTSNFYWSNTMYSQIFGSGTFNVLGNNDRSIDHVSYNTKGLLRYIMITE